MFKSCRLTLGGGCSCTDLLLVEDLHGVVLSRLSVPHQHDAAERAGAQSFQPLKLLQAGGVLTRHNTDVMFCASDFCLFVCMCVRDSDFQGCVIAVFI